MIGRLWLSRQSGSSTNQRVGGLIPGSSSPHINVSSGKILNPTLLLMAVPLVGECVRMSSWWAGWLFVEKSPAHPVWKHFTCVVKALWIVKGLEKRYLNTIHLPFQNQWLHVTQLDGGDVLHIKGLRLRSHQLSAPGFGSSRLKKVCVNATLLLQYVCCFSPNTAQCYNHALKL